MSSTATKIIKQAIAWIGKNESDGSHKEIIDVYNSHKPLARGYKMKDTDAWCSCFVSAVAIKCDATDIIPTEVGCEKHIELFKEKGIWIEDENRVPNPGDIIFFDWEDSGSGDNKGRANHVGIVEKSTSKTITVIDGNNNDSVARRTIKVNGKYIRGYGVPKYDEESKKEEAKKSMSTKTDSKTYTVVKGDTLSSIARKYKTTYQRIYHANKTLIDNENKKRGVAISKMWIYPGQKLVIK